MCFSVFITDTLALSPSKEKFQHVLKKTFDDIPMMLCAAAVPLDGSLEIQIPDEIHAMGEIEEKYHSPSHSPNTASRSLPYPSFAFPFLHS